MKMKMSKNNKLTTKKCSSEKPKQWRLYDALKAGKKISSAIAYARFGITNLPAVIYDLRRSGKLKKYKCEGGYYFI